jgi:hypothetical protein
VPLISGNAYSKGFVVGYGEGDYTTEEADYTNADPTFDYVEIGKAKITAYAEMTDESMKLPDAMYQAELLKLFVTLSARRYQNKSLPELVAQMQ